MAFVPAAVVPAATAAPAAETAATCAPVVLLTARGSGESLENGHGPTLTKLVDELHGTTLKDGFDGVSVPAKAIPYPAVPMEQYTGGKDHLDTDLFDSVDYGVIFGASMIDSILEDCKDTRFLLAGYSQGVIVARKLAEARGPDRIAGVIGVGDPAQRGNMPHIGGGGKGGDGIYRYMIRDEDGKAASDSFYDAGLKYAMWCHPQDWICNFVDEKDRPEDANNPLFATFDHSYPADPAPALPRNRRRHPRTTRPVCPVPGRVGPSTSCSPSTPPTRWTRTSTRPGPPPRASRRRCWPGPSRSDSGWPSTATRGRTSRRGCRWT